MRFQGGTSGRSGDNGGAGGDAMDPSAHLMPEEFAAYEAAPDAIPGPLRERVEGHLAACNACRGTWMDLSVERGEESEGVRPLSASAEVVTLSSVADAAWRRVAGTRAAAPRLARRLAVAASLLACAGIGWALVARGPAIVREGRFAPAGGEARAIVLGDRIAPDRAGVLTLSDGTRVRLSAGTALGLVSPAPGERLALACERGDAWFDVAKAPGGVSVRTPVGDLRVRGTRFRVRLWDDPAGGAGAPLVEVEVAEGAVEVAAGGESALLEAGGLAYVSGDAAGIRRVAPVPPSGHWIAETCGRFAAAAARGDGAEATYLVAVLARMGPDAIAEVRQRASLPEDGEPAPLWAGVVRRIEEAAARDASLNALEGG